MWDVGDAVMSRGVRRLAKLLIYYAARRGRI